MSGFPDRENKLFAILDGKDPLGLDVFVREKSHIRLQVLSPGMTLAIGYGPEIKAIR